MPVTVTKDEIQLRAREFLQRPSAPEVTEKEREAQCLAFLDAICGPGDEILGAFLFEIAQGANGRDVVKGDRLVTVYPSANERTNAARVLRTWHRGLAARAVKVEHTGEVKHKWDPSKLSLQELEQAEALHARALPEGAVDGAFTETPEPTAEKSEIQESDESED